MWLTRKHDKEANVNPGELESALYLGRGLGQPGVAAVPAGAVQEEAVDVDSSHLLWGRGPHVLPHHPGDLVAEDHRVQGPAFGQVGARGLLTHGRQETLEND